MPKWRYIIKINGNIIPVACWSRKQLNEYLDDCLKDKDISFIKINKVNMEQ